MDEKYGIYFETCLLTNTHHNKAVLVYAQTSIFEINLNATVCQV